MPENHLIELLHVNTGKVALVEDMESALSVSSQNGLREVVKELPVRKAEERLDIAVFDGGSRVGDDLIEDALGVPHASLRPLGNPGKAGIADFDALRLCNLSKRIGDLPQGHPPEIVALTAGEDRRRHLVNLSSGEHEKHVGRRFLNGFQEGVEGFLGQHVHFVDDVDLVAG